MPDASEALLKTHQLVQIVKISKLFCTVWLMKSLIKYCQVYNVNVNVSCAVRTFPTRATRLSPLGVGVIQRASPEFSTSFRPSQQYVRVANVYSID